MKFNCVHDVTDYNVVLWYCQRDGREYTLMGYLLESYETKEPDFAGRIQIKGDANANNLNSLTINSLTVDDTGVYFCAASQHSATSHLYSETKTLSLSSSILYMLTLCPC